MSQEPEFELIGEGSHAHSNEEWAELMARTIAHLAAQLTMTQIRLRALAGELAERDGIDANAVQVRVASIAADDAGTYLRENLGEALTDVIDTDALASEIVEFLTEER
jgi:hypothetical protein